MTFRLMTVKIRIIPTALNLDRRPLAGCDGAHDIRLGDECPPSVAAGFDNGVVVLEDPIREEILAQILPDIFDRIQLRRIRRQRQQRHVCWNSKVGRAMPTGAVKHEHGVGVLRDVAADLVEMELECPGIGLGRDVRRRRAGRGADRTKEIRPVVASVAQSRRA